MCTHGTQCAKCAKKYFLKKSSYPEPKEIKKNNLQFWEAKGVFITFVDGIYL
jgi:hypothetical protein